MTASATPLRVLHRRLAAAMGLASLAAFISGAGLDTPTPLIAAAALVLALFWAPGARLQRLLDPAWRILAVVLTGRAVYRVLISPDDIVLPMVDLLLVLLVSENLKESGAAGDTRVYSLSFALLIAACAYRPGFVFALSFIAYSALAVVTLTVGHLIRKLNEHQMREIKLERSFLFRIAGLSGVMLALSAVVFAAFPRVSRGWSIRGTQRGANVVGFADRVSLAEHGGRIYSNPEVVLRVEFPEGKPADTRALYWRGRSYDFFDGVAWDRSPALARTSPPAGFYAVRWPGRRTLERIYAVPLDIPVLFGIHPVLDVRPHSPMRVMQDNVGDLWYFGGGGTATYDVLSVTDRPSPDQLRRADGTPLRGARAYLQLPPLSARVKRLADSLTAGESTEYDKVMAVQGWLKKFRYTLDLPATAREATLENFLFRRRAGHCEYFSTAMAVLLREVGIPTRNVNGFLGGEWNDFGQFMTVSQNQAHSWIEVFFPGYGWVPFDGTPSATTDIAAQQEKWLPFHNVFDGLEHRWNKWILEYNLEKQVNLFARATEPFARRDSTGRMTWNPAILHSLKLIFAGLLLIAAIFAILRRTKATEAIGWEGRVYLRLRRAYEKAGFGARQHDAPLMFVQHLRNENAPGVEHAERAVNLYLRARFGGEELDEEARRELKEAIQRARKALRAA